VAAQFGIIATGLLAQFAADGLELDIFFWTGDPENGSGNVRSDVNLAVLRLLNARCVEIPFPQRVVWRRTWALSRLSRQS
jgi:small-conductance mechanosensitive channel